MMNIHGLDDSSLLAIFDEISVEDLLRAGRVCSRWNFIRAKSALTRHSLTLLVGEHARDRIDKSELDNIPYGQLLTDGYGMPLVPVKECADARNEIVRNKISSLNAKFLAHLFPNITNFTVSAKSDIKSVHSLVYLLKLWSTEPKLTTLKLYTYDRRDKRQIADKAERSQVSVNRRLLSTINSITSLRVLTFDIDSTLFNVKRELYAGDVELDFSTVLNQLERLHLYSCDRDYSSHDLVDTLTQFDNANDNLKEIGICSEHIMIQNDTTMIVSLARRFTQMCLNIDGGNISHFSSFCEHFANLTTLQLNVIDHVDNFGPVEFFPPLDSLPQLINLTIKADFINFYYLELASDNDAKEWLFGANRTNSVKVLKLQVITDEFNEEYATNFRGLYFNYFFPNVQVFIFELISDDITQSAVVDCDLVALKLALSWCTNQFKNLKKLHSINPDKEWPWNGRERIMALDEEDEMRLN